jgi:protein-S-isoprenylcysteine O-methyltransferase Ste14
MPAMLDGDGGAAPRTHRRKGISERRGGDPHRGGQVLRPPAVVPASRDDGARGGRRDRTRDAGWVGDASGRVAGAHRGSDASRSAGRVLLTAGRNSGSGSAARSAREKSSGVLVAIRQAGRRDGVRLLFGPTKPTGSNRLIKLLSVAGIVSGVLHLEAITHAHQMEWQRISISLLLYFAAFCTFWWTVRTNSSRPLSAIFSDDAPVHLVTSGPYRIVRHPFYCSYLLTWLAGVVATGGPWLVLTFLIMLGIYVRAAQAEERKFSSTLFAQAFQR